MANINLFVHPAVQQLLARKPELGQSVVDFQTEVQKAVTDGVMTSAEARSAVLTPLQEALASDGFDPRDLATLAGAVADTLVQLDGGRVQLADDMKETFGRMSQAFRLGGDDISTKMAEAVASEPSPRLKARLAQQFDDQFDSLNSNARRDGRPHFTIMLPSGAQEAQLGYRDRALELALAGPMHVSRMEKGRDGTWSAAERYAVEGATPRERTQALFELVRDRLGPSLPGWIAD